MSLPSIYQAFFLVAILFVVVFFTYCGTPAPTVSDQTFGSVGPASYTLTETIELPPSDFEVLTKLASGVADWDKNECVLLQIQGLRERDMKNIGIRLFINLPDADQETSKEVPGYVAEFTFGPLRPGQGQDFVFDLDRIIKAQGDDFLVDLDSGQLEVTLVPYLYYPDRVDDPLNLKLIATAFNLIIDCE